MCENLSYPPKPMHDIVRLLHGQFMCPNPFTFYIHGILSEFIARKYFKINIMHKDNISTNQGNVCEIEIHLLCQRLWLRLGLKWWNGYISSCKLVPHPKHIFPSFIPVPSRSYV